MDWNELAARVEPKTKPRKRKKYVYITILAVVIILPTWGIISFVRYRSRLRNQLFQLREEIRGRGEPIFFDELDAWYKWPPEGEPNAADVYLAADEAVDWPDEEWNDLPIIGKVDLPELGEPLPDELLEISRRFLDQNQKTIELIREAMGIEHCRYPVNLAESFNPRLTHAPRLQVVCRILSLYGLIAAVEDRHNDAAWSLLATLRVADSLKYEPNGISQVVRYAIIGHYAGQSLERILSLTNISEENINALESALKTTERSMSLRLALVAERSFFAEFFQMPLNEYLASGEVGLYQFLGSGTARIYVVLGRRDLMDYSFLSFYTYVMEHVDASPWEWEKIMDEWIEEHAPPSVAKDFKDVTSDMLIMFSYPLHAKYNSRCRVVILIMQTALAAEKYRLVHGDLPDSLSDLVPEFMDTMPIDPFDPHKEPLRYIRREEGGYVIYSVWENETDGGGRRFYEGRRDDYLFTVTR